MNWVLWGAATIGWHMVSIGAIVMGVAIATNFEPRGKK